MNHFRKTFGWFAVTILGSALFAFGFSCFLMPNDISTGLCFQESFSGDKIIRSN